MFVNQTSSHPRFQMQLLAGMLCVVGFASISPGQVALLEVTPIIPEGSSHTYAISGDGCVAVGESCCPVIDGFNRPIRWTWGGGTTALGAVPQLGFANPFHYLMAVNRDGTAAAGYAYDLLFTSQAIAIRWTFAGGVERLELGVPPDSSSLANDISGDGSVIVGVCSQGAFRWTEAGVEMLWLGEATAVSSDGSVIVGTMTMNGRTHAIRWTRETGPQDIGEFSPADVSSDGLVVVGDRL